MLLQLRAHSGGLAQLYQGTRQLLHLQKLEQRLGGNRGAKCESHARRSAPAHTSEPHLAFDPRS